MRCTTRLYALLGNPVSHSLSPLFQNAAFRAAGIDAHYAALACSEEELPTMMRVLCANGGGGNITIPHKTAAAAQGMHSARVSTLGVANVFGGPHDTIHLDNTDVDGVLYSLARIEAPASRWLIVGAGGSARAVVGAALEAGASIAVMSRTPEKARHLEEWAVTIGVTIVPADACEVVINTTPLGMQSGDHFPVKPREYPGLRYALDLVYKQAGTTLWVETCRAEGLAAIDGRDMLIAQGAASWKVWFPGVEPPVEVMRAALRRATVNG